MLKDDTDKGYWGNYLDHIGLFFIFTACAGVSIIVWVFNWVCWLNRCCCCDFLHNSLNKRIAWWISFIFLLGISACCISAFAKVYRFYCIIEGTWCAIDRIYYDSLYGQLKTSEPKWKGFQSLNELSSNLSDFYEFIKGRTWANILIPNTTWNFDETLGLWLKNETLPNGQKLLVTRYTKIINSLKSMENCDYKNKEQDKILGNIYNENNFKNLKKNFLDKFDYYVKTIKACLNVLVAVYYCLLLITIIFAIFSIGFYACLKQQGYLIKLMNVLWNIIRFFILSFFLYGTAYGIGFLAIRDTIAYIMYVFNQNLLEENTKLIGDGKQFFISCLLKSDSNLKNEFDKIYVSSLNDFFTNYNEIMKDTYENENEVYGNIITNLYNLNSTYASGDSNKLKNFNSLVEKAGKEGGIFGSFDCGFIKNDLNVLYTALNDASVESRILAALSLCSSFFGAVAVYFYLLVMHHYNNELFFDNGRRIFAGFDGFGGRYKKNNKNKDNDPAFKKRKMRAEIDLSSNKTDEQSGIKDSNINKIEE